MSNMYLKKKKKKKKHKQTSCDLIRSSSPVLTRQVARSQFSTGYSTERQFNLVQHCYRLLRLRLLPNNEFVCIYILKYLHSMSFKNLKCVLFSVNTYTHIKSTWQAHDSQCNRNRLLNKFTHQIQDLDWKGFYPISCWATSHEDDEFLRYKKKK